MYNDIKIELFPNLYYYNQGFFISMTDDGLIASQVPITSTLVRIHISILIILSHFVIASKHSNEKFPYCIDILGQNDIFQLQFCDVLQYV